MAFASLLIGFAASLATAFLLVPVVARIGTRAGWVDVPDRWRKNHTAPVPNAGGIAILFSAFVGVGAIALGAAFWPDAWGAIPALPARRVLVGALLASVLGLVDDRVDLRFQVKLVAQLLVVALTFSANLRIEVLDGVLGTGGVGMAASFALTALWMVGMMNAVNLIDGMDGLAAGVVAIALAGLAAVHAIGGDLGSLVLVVSVVGALLGFLRYNRSPASVFMGDSGSLFLGYVLAAYGLRGSAHEDPLLQLIIPAVVMGLPLLDLIVSVLRRKLMGHSLFFADHDHIHHRLAAQMSSGEAVRVLYWFSVFVALGACAMAAFPAPLAALTFALGSGVVYSFLRSIGYLPSPRRVAALLTNPEALRRAGQLRSARIERRRQQREAKANQGA
ncbi:MraY family glycosyltransferase [Rubricoccus marinus]|uniref:Undecaprenyl-phosphate alpha-N-acetylglucosaminyl 1-phosphate transferase n=1 Tax=Rubricoccus marinus TaxID=716817 RepID=A0A259TW11_9BACT|nr:MraY family glycosyltransferase [Rubricoccus marinus]OZC01955.1 hypothetical protein BSZ36_02530 [Rubricoccus marinus]